MVCNQNPGMIDWLLELGAARVARPVLRGGGGSDATSLPNHLANHLDIHVTHFSTLALKGVAPRNYRVIQDRAHLNKLQQQEAA